MKKYWIIVNGQPVGPFTPEELKQRSDFRADLPVWYSGLPEWSTVAQLPELAAMLSRPIDVEPFEVQAEQPRQQQRTGWTSSAPASNPVEEKCPPTYMAWNIFLTICCCLPVGIVGIFFGSKVNQRYMSGDMEGARRASERAAWCLMIAIVLGLLTFPLQIITTLL